MLRADTLDMVDTLLSDAASPSAACSCSSSRISPAASRGQAAGAGAALQLYYESSFFFDAQVLRQYPPVHVQLEKVYRQQDQRFVTLLNHLRYNETTPSERAWLESRVRRSFDPSRSEGYVCLTTHNQRAEEINRRALEELPGAYQDYHAQIRATSPTALPRRPHALAQGRDACRTSSRTTARRPALHSGSLATWRR